MKTTLVVLALMVAVQANAADAVPSVAAPTGDVPASGETTRSAAILFMRPDLTEPPALVTPPAPLPDGGYLDPCAAHAGDQDTVVVLYSGGLLADGGQAVPLPTPICAGQRVPVAGVFLTQARAADLAGTAEANRQLADDLKKELAKRPDSAIPGYVWLISCTLSVAASAYLFRKL